MGFDDSFKIAVSDTESYKQAGNSIVVDVMLAVVREIIKTGVFDSQLVESYNMENLIV